MAKGRRKSNREAKKPKKTPAEKSRSAAVSTPGGVLIPAYKDRARKGGSA
jgi:hypothetical protein